MIITFAAYSLKNLSHVFTITLSITYCSQITCLICNLVIIAYCQNLHTWKWDKSNNVRIAIPQSYSGSSIFCDSKQFSFFYLQGIWLCMSLRIITRNILKMIVKTYRIFILTRKVNIVTQSTTKSLCSV